MFGINVVNNNNEATKLQRKLSKNPSISASSTDEDADSDTLTNEEAKRMHKMKQQQTKTKQKNTHQSRVRPVSISDMCANNDEQLINYKVAIRAKSVESTDISPLKQPQQQQQPQQLGNDLAPPSNYNLKSLSIEHRLANISQMSISSQLSKTNSIRHNNRSGACDTPVQHVHSSTPTPRESIVFNRGDEKPIAKILLQQQQLYKLNQQQQQQQQIIELNGEIEKEQLQLKSTSNNDLKKLKSSDSELSEYENTTLKSNRILINNSNNNNSNNNNNNNANDFKKPGLPNQQNNKTMHTFSNNNNNSDLIKKGIKDKYINNKDGRDINSNNSNKCCCIL